MGHVADARPTPLRERHEALGARMVPFAGFLMPLSYSGQIAEHEAVRKGLGLFDLSHMGEFRLRGTGALAAAERLLTNRLVGTASGQAVYSPMCRDDGGIVDDLIAYHLPDSVLLVVNASNIAKDAAWVREHLPTDVAFSDESDDTALLAVQGPRSQAFLSAHTAVPLSGMETYTALSGTVLGVAALVSRTGYTGEDGFELYVAARDAVALWDRLLDAGALHGMLPIGLAARDTLRFEMGYCLYGNDIDETTHPLEAGLGWTVRLDKGDFVGREAIYNWKTAGVRRRLLGLAPEESRVIPRAGCPVLSATGNAIGKVTSGTFAPSLDRGLALAYVDAAHTGPGVVIDVRGRRVPASVTPVPFYRGGSRKAPPRRAPS